MGIDFVLTAPRATDDERLMYLTWAGVFEMLDILRTLGALDDEEVSLPDDPQPPRLEAPVSRGLYEAFWGTQEAYRERRAARDQAIAALRRRTTPGRVYAFKFEAPISDRLTPDECRTITAAVHGHEREAHVAPFAAFFAFIERAIDRGGLTLR